MTRVETAVSELKRQLARTRKLKAQYQELFTRGELDTRGVGTLARLERLELELAEMLGLSVVG